MNYQVSRNGQVYGPYTLDDLRRYVATGNVLLTDMAKSEEMPEWMPVSQLLDPAATGPTDTAPAGHAAPTGYVAAPAAYGAAGGYAQGGYAQPGSVYPDPPNLHWALVLVIGIFTFGLFFVIWDLIQVLWLKKVEPGSQALMLFIAYAVCWVLSLGKSFGNTVVMMSGGRPHASMIAGIISLASLILIITYRFVMKSDLERHFNGPDPVGLRLGPIMTFFFGGLYFQYHFNRINEVKRALRYQSLAR